MAVLDQLKVGQPVVYVPKSAYGVKSHPDCRDGYVAATGWKGAYVRLKDQSGELGIMPKWIDRQELQIK